MSRALTDAFTELSRMLPGAVLHNEPMNRHTTFRIGGPADIFVSPESPDDLRRVIVFAKENGLPVTTVGGGSNLLVRDDGIRGVTVHLSGPYFTRFYASGASVISGASLSLNSFLRFLANNGLTGLESLYGVPGALGGAIVRNAGVRLPDGNDRWCRISDFIREVKVMDLSGYEKNLVKDEIAFGYRESGLCGYVVMSARFEFQNEGISGCEAMLSAAFNRKRKAQDLSWPSAGCVFKNPEGGGLSAGALIESCGLKGRTIGGAAVSATHANFIVNRGGATAADVLALIESVRREVRVKHGIELELEVEVV